MPSPFPGMNPYLEQADAWHDFHQRFCTTCAEVLSAQVRPKYVVKLEEHVYIHEPPAEDRLFIGRGDVAVSKAPGGPAMASAQGQATVTRAPVYALIPPAVDTVRESFIELRDGR